MLNASKPNPVKNQRAREDNEQTSELALEYIISSALKTTIGSFICHSLFFLVAVLCLSYTNLIKQLVGIEQRNQATTKQKKKKSRNEDPLPQNLMYD